jgi:hypothetical protein
MFKDTTSLNVGDPDVALEAPAAPAELPVFLA